MSKVSTSDANKVTINDNFLRNIDEGVTNWFAKDFPIDFEGRKTPVIFVSQERWALAQKQKGFRDENGVIILPLITVRRLESSELYKRYVPKMDETKVFVVKRVATQTYDNNERLVYDEKTMGVPIYEVVMAQYPTFVTLRYNITLHTSFLSQANQLQENIWKKFDSGRSYFTHNDYYMFATINSSADQSNVEDFVDNQRLIKYSYSFEIQAPLISKSDVKIERTFIRPVITTKEY